VPLDSFFVRDSFLPLICFCPDTMRFRESARPGVHQVWMSAVIFQFRADALSKEVIVLPPVKQAVNVKGLIIVDCLGFEGDPTDFWLGRVP